MDDATKETGNKELDSYASSRLVEMVRAITQFIERDYREREKLIGSVRNFEDFKSVIPLALKLPYVLGRRSFVKTVCRIRGKPYHDFISPSPFPEKLKAWRKKNGFTANESAMEFGVSLKKYIAFENGYQEPKGEMYVKFINRIYRKD